MLFAKFEKTIEYDKELRPNQEKDKRSCRLFMHGDIPVGERAYTVFMNYCLNTSERFSLYHNDFEILEDSFNYTIIGPFPSMFSICPFKSLKGKSHKSFKKDMTKIAEDQGLTDIFADNVVTDLDVMAMDFFYEWKNKEIEKIWPASKPMSLKLENVKYTDDSCILDLKLSLDKDYDMCIELHPHDDRTWFLGTNTWDIVGDMIISIKGDCKFYCNYGDWKQKFNVFFGNVKDLPHFKGMVEDFIEKYAMKWKESYFKAFYEQHFLNKYVSDKIEWGFDFMEPMMTTDTTIWGTGSIKLTFSKKRILDALDDDTLSFTNPRDFARYLTKFIYGEMKLNIDIPEKPNIISCTRNNMEKGDFLCVIKRLVCTDSQKSIINEIEKYLINEFWGEKFTLPKNTDNVLKELGASYKQRRIVAEDFELIKGGKNE